MIHLKQEYESLYLHYMYPIQQHWDQQVQAEAQEYSTSTLFCWLPLKSPHVIGFHFQEDLKNSLQKTDSKEVE